MSEFSFDISVVCLHTALLVVEVCVVVAVFVFAAAATAITVLTCRPLGQSFTRQLRAVTARVTETPNEEVYSGQVGLNGTNT